MNRKTVYIDKKERIKYGRKIKSKHSDKKGTNNNVAKTVKNNIARCIRTVVKIWGSVERLDSDDIGGSHAIARVCVCAANCAALCQCAQCSQYASTGLFYWLYLVIGVGCAQNKTDILSIIIISIHNIEHPATLYTLLYK